MHRALKKSIDDFTHQWGEIGAFWGINKVMGQLYALLFASDKPLTLDDMCRQLGISRGNASMNIRALKEWGVVHKVHVPGDRKDYYELDEDIWKIIAHFVRERKKRELEPVLRTLHRNAAGLEGSLGGMNGPERRRAAVFLSRLHNMRRISEAVDHMLQKFLDGEEVHSSSLTSIPIRWK